MVGDAEATKSLLCKAHVHAVKTNEFSSTVNFFTKISDSVRKGYRKGYSQAQRIQQRILETSPKNNKSN